MRHFNENRAYFFHFVTWISLSCLEILLWYSRIFWHEKLENLSWYSCNTKIKKLKPEVFGSCLRWYSRNSQNQINWNQRYSARRAAVAAAPAVVGASRLLRPPQRQRRPGVPNTSGFNLFDFASFVKPPKAGAETSGFNLFDFRITWNHPRFQVFMSKYSWNYNKIPNNSMKPGHKKKCAVSI